jgi:hypothetical protein
MVVNVAAMRGGKNRRYLRGTGLAAVLLCALLVGTALAASNRLRISVPSHAKVETSYTVTIRGSTAKKETLYLFVDYFRCAGSPYAEHYKHGANGDYWIVKGKFLARSPGWKSPRKAPYHACTYLVKASAPLKARHGVLLRKSKTFKVR